ncbi:hypothetical protein [Turneriella parva]|uniref:Uncharacterized protein n=1 Tax=Turneriella parva (strain ATCC BAA-1111 / DSM 21527 / NCTC 11395 / H) TaxID=869212 RepID=I4B4B3_TURPD|nr:hypothetical protein [Turneriella parva]AFM12120.1 hypothetical protein Turpa_1472 [Turneriella parva DSM 21527]
MKLFTQNVSNFLPLIGSYFFSMTLTIVLPIKIITAQNDLGSYLLFGLMAIGGSFLFTSSLWLQLKAPRTIEINPEILIATFHLNRRKRIPLSDIIAIGRFWASKHAIKIEYKMRGRNNYFFTHIDLVKLGERFAVGELSEILLQNASEIEGVDIDKFIELNYRGQSAWGKTPDWTIINTAKRRAEENRKKAQSSAPQASPAASARPLAGGAPVRAEGDTTPPPL